jgi:hypothetical protein
MSRERRNRCGLKGQRFLAGSLKAAILHHRAPDANVETREQLPQTEPLEAHL